METIWGKAKDVGASRKYFPRRIQPFSSTLHFLLELTAFQLYKGSRQRQSGRNESQQVARILLFSYLITQTWRLEVHLGKQNGLPEPNQLSLFPSTQQRKGIKVGVKHAKPFKGKRKIHIFNPTHAHRSFSKHVQAQKSSCPLLATIKVMANILRTEDRLWGEKQNKCIWP